MSPQNKLKNPSSKIVELFSTRTDLAYQSTYVFSTQELKNLTGDHNTVLKLCEIVDVLSLLDISCKNNGWKASAQIGSCSLALIKLLMQLTRAEHNKSDQ